MSSAGAASFLSALRILSSRDGCSVAQLAAELGLGVDCANDLVAQLSAAGMLTEAAGGECLRLTTPFVALDRGEVERQLGALGSAFSVEVVDQTGSTNDDLLERARQGEQSHIVRVAEIQTAGRGRRQRRWLSAPGSALTFSLLWRFDRGPAQLSGLSLAVGVALVRTLRALGAVDAQLKWPNDLVCRGHKLGGILIETMRNADGTTSAIIGIGINVRLPAALSQRIDQAATDLVSGGVRTDRNSLLVRLLESLKTVLDAFVREGFVALRPEWQRLHAYQDKMVRLVLADGPLVEGRVIGVDDKGALLLETARGRHAFHSGEVSLRPVTDV